MKAQRKPRPVRDGCVEFLGAGRALVDKVQGFAPKRFLQTVGQEAGDFRPHLQRLHAKFGVDFDSAIDVRCRGASAPEHLDQRQQIDRIERMADDDAFGVFAIGLERAGQKAGRTGSDDYLRWRRSIDLGMQKALQVEPFRRAFLHEICLCAGILQRRRAAQPRLAGTRKEPELAERRPSVGHGAT